MSVSPPFQIEVKQEPVTNSINLNVLVKEEISDINEMPQIEETCQESEFSKEDPTTSYPFADELTTLHEEFKKYRELNSEFRRVKFKHLEIFKEETESAIQNKETRQKSEFPKDDPMHYPLANELKILEDEYKKYRELNSTFRRVIHKNFEIFKEEAKSATQKKESCQESESSKGITTPYPSADKLTILQNEFKKYRELNSQFPKVIVKRLKNFKQKAKSTFEKKEMCQESEFPKENPMPRPFADELTILEDNFEKYKELNSQFPKVILKRVENFKQEAKSAVEKKGAKKCLMKMKDNKPEENGEKIGSCLKKLIEFRKRRANSAHKSKIAENNTQKMPNYRQNSLNEKSILQVQKTELKSSRDNTCQWTRKRPYIILQDINKILLSRKDVGPRRKSERLNGVNRTMKQRFNCGDCGKFFIKEAYLQKHLTTHLRVSPRKVCKYVYRNREEIIHHMLTYPSSM
ncbi:uncharacterized protein [Periplaneta americana]|uniref:uncharacterized protein isoform X3 n=1 Tax=Periplaneta americana TaxID=6978 RepID=UPI0037E92943